jgi:hypothetical protein
VKHSVSLLRPPLIRPQSSQHYNVRRSSITLQRDVARYFSSLIMSQPDDDMR